jgi:hypothetical protein
MAAGGGRVISVTRNAPNMQHTKRTYDEHFAMEFGEIHLTTRGYSSFVCRVKRNPAFLDGAFLLLENPCAQDYAVLRRVAGLINAAPGLRVAVINNNGFFCRADVATALALCRRTPLDMAAKPIVVSLRRNAVEQALLSARKDFPEALAKFVVDEYVTDLHPVYML